jgi:hypothetical protein
MTIAATPTPTFVDPQQKVGSFYFYFDCAAGGKPLDYVTDRIVYTPGSAEERSAKVYTGKWDGKKTTSFEPTARPSTGTVDEVFAKVDADHDGTADNGSMIVAGVPTGRGTMYASFVYMAETHAPAYQLNGYTPYKAIDLNGDGRTELLVDPALIESADLSALGDNADTVLAAVKKYKETKGEPAAGTTLMICDGKTTP